MARKLTEEEMKRIVNKMVKNEDEEDPEKEEEKPDTEEDQEEENKKKKECGNAISEDLMRIQDLDRFGAEAGIDLKTLNRAKYEDRITADQLARKLYTEQMKRTSAENSAFLEALNKDKVESNVGSVGSAPGSDEAYEDQMAAELYKAAFNAIKGEKK